MQHHGISFSAFKIKQITVFLFNRCRSKAGILHQNIRWLAQRKHRSPAWDFIICQIIINPKMWQSISKHAGVDLDKEEQAILPKTHLQMMQANPKSSVISRGQNETPPGEKCPWQFDLSTFKRKVFKQMYLVMWVSSGPGPAESSVSCPT